MNRGTDYYGRRIKPHIQRAHHRGAWGWLYIGSAGKPGWGETPAQAYDAWLGQ